MSNLLSIAFETAPKVGRLTECPDPDLRDGHGKPVMTEGRIARVAGGFVYVQIEGEPDAARRFKIAGKALALV